MTTNLKNDTKTQQIAGLLIIFLMRELYYIINPSSKIMIYEHQLDMQYHIH